MYQTIVFDLDGTLIDSQQGVTKSVRYAVEKMELSAPPLEELRVFIGPPLYDSFQKQFGFDRNQAERAIAFYREYYVAAGIYEHIVYPGIRELLQMLYEAGKRVIVATSKPGPFAEKILREEGLWQYIYHLEGATMDESVTDKTLILEQGLLRGEGRAVMIGDRHFDVCAAHDCGIDSVGVLYGFGSEAELQECRPTYLIKTVADLFSIFSLPQQ